MILDWPQLALCYGTEVDDQRKHFETAGETTYALLCCRLTQGNDRLEASGGAHAERKLLSSPLWTQEIPGALHRWSPLDRSAVVVTLVINRTPCRACTEALVESLTALQWRFAAAFERARFILACRGAYQGKVTDAGYYEHATTVGGLLRLQRAGWSLCVLQTGDHLSPSGKQLLQALRGLRGVGAGQVQIASR